METALLLSSNTALTQQQRDVGIAAALLHDYGKAWIFGNPQPGSWAKNPRHEVLGLQKLRSLAHGRYDTKPGVMELLTVLERKRCPATKFQPALATMVYAADQMSCERNKHAGLRIRGIASQSAASTYCIGH